MIPNSPKPVFPSIRATSIDEINPRKRAMTAPDNDQKAPRANRQTRGDASIRAIIGLKYDGINASNVAFIFKTRSLYYPWWPD
jgi:hypothetical protein